MMELFKRAFRRENTRGGGPEAIMTEEPPEAPNIPSLAIIKNRHGKWVYAQPANPDYDPETHTLLLKTRRPVDRKFESFIAIRNPELLVLPVDFDTMSHDMLTKCIYEAREYARRIPKSYVHVSDLLRLTFYVYFKQATEGDITEWEVRQQPSLFRDWEGYWKVYGWKMTRGMSREEARNRYVKLFNETVTSRAEVAWAPQGFDEYFLKGEEEPEEDRLAREAADAGKASEQLARERRDLEDSKWVAFFEAVRIIRNFPRRPYQMPEPMRAMFYALYKQATVGDLRAFQRSDACQQNAHYAWCRQRPATPPVNAKKEKEKRNKLEKERKERDKREKRDRAARESAGRAEYEWAHSGHNGKAVPLSEPTSAVYDPEQEIDDPRTFDQLRYDFWMEQEGNEPDEAMRKYLKYYYRIAARHGYLWDPPGSEDHMSEVMNQYTTKTKKQWMKEKGLDMYTGSEDTSTTGDLGSGPCTRARRKPTEAESAIAIQQVAEDVLATPDVANLSAEEKRKLNEEMQKAVSVDEEGAQRRFAREEAARAARKGARQESEAPPCRSPSGVSNDKREGAKRDAASAAQVGLPNKVKSGRAGGHADPMNATATSSNPTRRQNSKVSTSTMATKTKGTTAVTAHGGKGAAQQVG